MIKSVTFRGKSGNILIKVYHKKGKIDYIRDTRVGDLKVTAVLADNSRIKFGW